LIGQLANVGMGVVEVAIEAVGVGDVVQVRPGERVPVDGRILTGESAVDESLVTGESLPVDKVAGEGVLSGSVNGSGAVEIVATAPAADSQYQRIVALVREAADSKAPLVRLADRYALPFTAVSLGIAGLAWALSGDPVRFAEVLVLGDSFTNIYSMEELGWGTSAGLAEQLAFALQRPVDRIAQNDAGSNATRRLLSRELARGTDRLAGKKVVVWQFAMRELAFGDWPLLPMEVGSPPPAGFLDLPAGTMPGVMAVIRDASIVPQPGSVPYRDHIRTLHLQDLSELLQYTYFQYLYLSQKLHQKTSYNDLILQL
jgi:hypothetical protein